ncbi:MAG: hypothetical protein MK175_08100 [Pseudoalteromonas sp.]|uniref:hypothetical protein n=1 Tax=Pseudoalteromonas sp. TaxID=53249 RepID=UPI0025FB827C|nr:hypothetical protein [Pseudoalteromonas sp.]MCH2087135.1 hypothetical protein [Pseudoalteromonas sp.]
MSEKTIKQLEQDLESAKRELEQWEEHDAHRSDGSQRQDDIHERIGRDLKNKVYKLERELDAKRKSDK